MFYLALYHIFMAKKHMKEVWKLSSYGQVKLCMDWTEKQNYEVSILRILRRKPSSSNASDSHSGTWAEYQLGTSYPNEALLWSVPGVYPKIDPAHFS
jgi:hypothetical protein